MKAYYKPNHGINNKCNSSNATEHCNIDFCIHNNNSYILHGSENKSNSKPKMGRDNNISIV